MAYALSPIGKDRAVDIAVPLFNGTCIISNRKKIVLLILQLYYLMAHALSPIEKDCAVDIAVVLFNGTCIISNRKRLCC